MGSGLADIHRDLRPATWYIHDMSKTLGGQAGYLVRVAGPPIRDMHLTREGSPVTLGRHEHCELRTPADEERISRYHAQFSNDGTAWYVTDLNSTWGTYLNGYRLPPDKPHVLTEGDLIRVTPWTFSFRHVPALAHAITASDDLRQTVTAIRSLAPAEQSAIADPLVMLVEAAAGIHQAADEITLAQLILDFARRGTGYTHAAYLRPSDADGNIEVVATAPQREQGVYSRSLLNAASSGELAILDPLRLPASHSIISLQIQAGLCAPLMLGQTVAAYLYLDSRSESPEQHAHRRAPEFCQALARIASLALANLKRIDIERRQAAMNAELAQAAAMQRCILPPRCQEFAGLRIIGESRPGQLLGGDFFDVVPLDEHRVVITIGDVSGKGVAASVLMTAIHGFLHATLLEDVPLDVAVCRLNDFMEPRRPEGCFATMFVALIDTMAGTISYVDAAHGYGMLWDGKILVPLRKAGGLPMGVFPGHPYTSETVAFPPGAMLVALSDGIIEQPRVRGEDDHRQQFDVAGVFAVLSRCDATADVVTAVFEGVQKHAGMAMLADDATMVIAQRQ